jgi:hypothetical protein
LRFSDLDIDDQFGRIPNEENDKHFLEPGQGISLFLERLIPDGFSQMKEEEWKKVNKKERKKIFWWSVDQGHPIPVSLVLLYDGVPPGHCVLSVTQKMPVTRFLDLISKIPFRKTDISLIGPS